MIFRNYLLVQRLLKDINILNRNKKVLAMTLFIEMPVPSQKSERSCICVLGLTILPLSTFLIRNIATTIPHVTDHISLDSETPTDFNEGPVCSQ
jgi:hypothetical protein